MTHTTIQTPMIEQYQKFFIWTFIAVFTINSLSLAALTIIDVGWYESIVNRLFSAYTPTQFFIDRILPDAIRAVILSLILWITYRWWKIAIPVIATSAITAAIILL